VGLSRPLAPFGSTADEAAARRSSGRLSVAASGIVRLTKSQV